MVSGGELLTRHTAMQQGIKVPLLQGNKGAIVLKGPQLEHRASRRGRAGEGRPPVKYWSRTVEVLAIKRAAVELWESPSALGDVLSRLSCYITTFY